MKESSGYQLWGQRSSWCVLTSITRIRERFRYSEIWFHRSCQSEHLELSKRQNTSGTWKRFRVRTNRPVFWVLLLDSKC